MEDSLANINDDAMDISSFDKKSLHRYINCDSCGKPNPKLRCSRCHYAYYCTAVCQRKHWPRVHKKECLSIEEMQAEIAGMRGEKLFMEETEPINSSCGICLAEPMKDPWTLKGCRHGFCFDCLCGWQKYSMKSWVPSTPDGDQQNPRCPFCRTAMDTKDVKQQALERAGMFAARSMNAESSLSKVEHLKLIDEALAEIDKILEGDPENVTALLFKAQVLKQTKPDESIRLFETSFRLHEATKVEIEAVEQLYDEAEEAVENGNMAEYDRLVSQAVDKSNPSIDLSSILKKADLVQIKLEYAEAYILCGKLVEAVAVYQDLMKANGTMQDPNVDRRVYRGLSQCAFRLKDYEKALVGAEAALSINVHFPGAHKYVARVLEAQGNISAAIQTIAQGILYEAPWEKGNLRENILYLSKLRAASGAGR